MSIPTIRHAPADFLDEFIAEGVTIHFESMSDAQFWIGITTADGRMWHINCGAVNPQAKGYSRVEEIR